MAEMTPEQPTFTVGTDLSDGKLSVVVMKHESGITQVIHSEVIQLTKQHINVAPDLKVLREMLEKARHHVDSPPVTMVKTVRGGFIQEIDAILKLLHKG